MTYIIDWSSRGTEGITGKSFIRLDDKTYDTTSTSLTLTGKSVQSYGEIQQENFLHLLENFASATEPAHATIGQLWFDTGTNTLKVKTAGGSWQKSLLADPSGKSISTTALSLENPRTISISGDATWSVTFSGLANVSNAITLATVNTSPVSNAFKKVTVNAKGLTTATSEVLPIDITTALGYVPLSNTGDMTLTGNLNVTGIITTDHVPTQGNEVVRLNDLRSIPNDLMITTIGSLDIQFSVVNQYASSVTNAGTPSYISNFTDPINSPMLNYGYNPTGNGTMGTPQTVAPYIIGNASSLGENFSVINAQYGTLLKPTTYAVTTASAGVNYTYSVSGTVTMVLDIASASGLEDNQYVSGTTTINPRWKGNFKFSAFSSLFKLHEAAFWDYVNAGTAPHAGETFEYSVNMTPITSDYTNTNYGKYTVVAKVFAAASYHAANLGARWMGLATKVRNI